MNKDNPQHLAIILDGNRRFARRLMLEPWRGHEFGAEKVEKILEYAESLGIKEMTLYCLSIENLKTRPKEELEYLFKILKKSLHKLTEKRLKKTGLE